MTPPAPIPAVVPRAVLPAEDDEALLSAMVRLLRPDGLRVLTALNADRALDVLEAERAGVGVVVTDYVMPRVNGADLDLFREVVAAALVDCELVLENRRLRRLAEEQAIRLEQWNQRLEEVVSQRTADLEKVNLYLERGLLDTVCLLLAFLERRLPDRANRCRDVARLAAGSEGELNCAGDAPTRTGGCIDL